VPTKRIMLLIVMVDVGFLLVVGASHVWAAKTLATSSDDSISHTVAEVVTLV
jgi:hypothetical protein